MAYEAETLLGDDGLHFPGALEARDDSSPYKCAEVITHSTCCLFPLHSRAVSRLIRKVMNRWRGTSLVIRQNGNWRTDCLQSESSTRAPPRLPITKMSVGIRLTVSLMYSHFRYNFIH